MVWCENMGKNCDSVTILTENLVLVESWESNFAVILLTLWGSNE